jgi:hypothetical protein
VIRWGGPRLLLADSIFFLPLWLGVVLAWEEYGSSIAAGVTAVVAALTLRWLCVVVFFGSERVRVVNRLWVCSVPVADIRAVGSVAVYTWTRAAPSAVLMYLRDGSAVPVVATARSFYGPVGIAMRLADLYDVPIVVRAPRSAIDAAIASESAGRKGGRWRRAHRAYLDRAKSPEEVGVEFPVDLRRGRLKPTSLGMAPDSSYREPELPEFE